MTIMQSRAMHHLKVIFHEKPSGRHRERKALQLVFRTDTGVKLLSRQDPDDESAVPGLYSSVPAVYKHHYLLMASVCTYGNISALRNEAPPPMSVFWSTSRSSIDFNPDNLGNPQPTNGR